MLTAARWADTIVIQEALLPRFLLHAIKRIGKRIVYDFSDPVHMPHPDQSAVRQLLHKVIDFRRFDQTLRSANCCLVENALLAPVADARGCPPMIAPGPIDVRRFPERPPTARQQVNVGWLGSPGTYCQLEPLLPILEEVGKECGNVRLTLLGAGKVQPRLPHVDVEVFPWKLESEPAIMSDFDIAICFLKMTPWTRARGGSKLLAYMAAGAPIISSPAGIGDQVVDPLCGLLADTDEQWKAALLKLIRDSDLRRSMAQASRALAIQKYSYEAMLPTLLKALRLSPAKPLSDASQQAA
jgi:glycosyltransferase involved in cell wall biosynthesis